MYGMLRLIYIYIHHIFQSLNLNNLPPPHTPHRSCTQAIQIDLGTSQSAVNEVD